MKVNITPLCLTLCSPVDYTVHGILQARILEWVAFPFSRGSSQPRNQTNPGLPHCRWILYQLSHKGSPRILEWVAYPFSKGSSLSRNRTRVSCIAGGFFTNWAMREAHTIYTCICILVTLSHLQVYSCCCSRSKNKLTITKCCYKDKMNSSQFKKLKQILSAN